MHLICYVGTGDDAHTPDNDDVECIAKQASNSVACINSQRKFSPNPCLADAIAKVYFLIVGNNDVRDKVIDATDLIRFAM